MVYDVTIPSSHNTIITTQIVHSIKFSSVTVLYLLYRYSDANWSVPGAGTGHPGQDCYADKDEGCDYNVNGIHSHDDKSPRNTADDKSKADEINYKGHDVVSWFTPYFLAN
jgi:hypothetical protein